MSLFSWCNNLIAKCLNKTNENQPLITSEEQINKKTKFNHFIYQFISMITTTGSASGAIENTWNIYARAIGNCPPRDPACSNQILEQLGYVGLSAAYLDFILQTITQHNRLSQYKAIKLTKVLWDSLVDCISIHGFALQFALYLHTEIIRLFSDENNQDEIHTTKEIFIFAEVLPTAIFAVLANPPIRTFLRNTIFGNKTHTRTKTDIGLDFFFELFRGFATGRAITLSFENFGSSFTNSDFPETLAGTWLRWGIGIGYGLTFAGLTLKYAAKEDNLDAMLRTRWPSRVQNIINGLFYIFFTVMVLKSNSTPHREIQTGLGAFLLFAITTRVLLATCCCNSNDEPLNRTSFSSYGSSSPHRNTINDEENQANKIEIVPSDFITTGNSEKNTVAYIVDSINKGKHPVFQDDHSSNYLKSNNNKLMPEIKQLFELNKS